MCIRDRLIASIPYIKMANPIKILPISFFFSFFVNMISPTPVSYTHLADIGLMSIEYTCFDGEEGFTQSLCLTNTGVNTSKLNRLEHFIRNFETEGKTMSGNQLHDFLDSIEEIHGLYSPITLGLSLIHI